MALETIFDFNITLSKDADVSILFQAAHVYTATGVSNPWGLTCAFDGVGIKSIGGGGDITITPTFIAGRQNTPAGARRVLVQWYGSPNMKLSGADIVVNIRYR